ncbi:hypothetical protein K7X08_021398 [Anisodus acutangulus]|uniref:Uncharacterized protein n=1 Tax=Anisodus acutangulus TaxID=402998 RepID=A0A9Q1RAU3_9SOLA|nr:hypothetical protein K7X08_021398 [Anisodus acutangulus]
MVSLLEFRRSSDNNSSGKMKCGATAGEGRQPLAGMKLFQVDDVNTTVSLSVGGWCLRVLSGVHDRSVSV